MQDSHDLKDIESYWSASDIPRSEASYKALLPQALSLQGAERCHLIELKALLARCQAYQEHYLAAHALLGEALLILEEPDTVFPISSRIRWLVEKGRLHILEKTPSQARRFFSEAWTLACQSGEDYFAVEIALLMATTEPQKTQQEWLTRAIELAENSSQAKTRKWLGSLYSSMGSKFYDLHQYDNSMLFFQKALKQSELEGDASEAFLARRSIGKILRITGKTTEALFLQQELLAGLTASGKKDGRLYEELAECLQALNRPQEAQTYFELAYRELSDDRWITDNQPTKLKRMKDLGKVKL